MANADVAFQGCGESSECVALGFSEPCGYTAGGAGRHHRRHLRVSAEPEPPYTLSLVWTPLSEADYMARYDQFEF